MLKIGDVTATANPSSEFTEGAPTTGVPPTLIKAAWLTTVQRELIAILAAANITPAVGDDDQVVEAITSLIRSNATGYVADTGTANTYLAAYPQPVTALVDGMVLKFKAKTANTGPSTFKPNGLAAKPILGAAHAALQGGEIAPNGDVWLQYNSSLGGGSWVMIHSTGGALQVLAATQSQHAMSLGQATGRILNIQIITTSGTITKTPGANKWIVEGGGGGGEGGGTQATGSAQIATGGGGSSGATAKAVFDVSGITTATAVIGDAGAGAANGAAGNAGGTTTLTMGPYSLTLPGGPGGGVGVATASLPNDGGSAASFSAAPSHVGALAFEGTAGGGATTAINLSLASAQAGIGGSTPYGSSRQSGNAVGYCAGGPGARSLINTGANNGPSGAKGILIIYELS